MQSDQVLATILLIDRSSDEDQSVRHVLAENQYRVFHVTTADEALQTIQYINPDLILLNGWQLDEQVEEICRRVRNASIQSANLPFIYLQPVNGHCIKNDEEIISYVDDCFLLPHPASNKKPSKNDSLKWDQIVQISHMHLLSLLRGHLQIRNLKTSVEESQRQLSRAHRIMDRELGETAKMQRSFLPGDFPKHPELELAAIYQPSIKVGGDYYDVLPIDETHWGLVIADIAGHGSAAAVVMALTQMVVKEFGKGIVSPQEALFIFNKKLNDNLASDHYVTMFYAVLDLETMELVYSHAGHVPLMIYKASDHTIGDIKTEPSFPLRTFDMESYEEKRTILQPGDKVLFFTDGVIDIQNSQNHFFGAERLKNVFLESQPASVKKVIKNIFECTEMFRGSRERLDDFTLMALGRKYAKI